MSYDAAVSALRRYADVSANEIDVNVFAEVVRSESDRGAIILGATLADDTLASLLRLRMTTLNKRELDDMFGFSGAAGTFSGRIKLAQALGIISREQRRRIDLLRHMRNACAHGRQELSFATPEVRDAIPLLVDEDLRSKVADRAPGRLRDLFALICAALTSEIFDSRSPAPAMLRSVIVNVP